MKLVIDRIEDGVAVLEKEDLTHIEVKIEILPEGVREGNVLDFENGIYVIDKDEEHRRREEIIALRKKLNSKRK